MTAVWRMAYAVCRMRKHEVCQLASQDLVWLTNPLFVLVGEPSDDNAARCHLSKVSGGGGGAKHLEPAPSSCVLPFWTKWGSSHVQLYGVRTYTCILL